MQKGPFYKKFYFSLDKWNEEKILNSPFNWILKLTEKEYVGHINKVLSKYKLKDVDKRYEVLKQTDLFDDESITAFL